MKLRIKREEEQQIKIDIEKLSQEIGNLNVVTLSKDKRRLEMQYGNITKEVSFFYKSNVISYTLCHKGFLTFLTENVVRNCSCKNYNNLNCNIIKNVNIFLPFIKVNS